MGGPKVWEQDWEQQWLGELDPLTSLPRQQGLQKASDSPYRGVIHRYETNSSRQLSCCEFQWHGSSPPKPTLFLSRVQPQKQHFHPPDHSCQQPKRRQQSAAEEAVLSQTVTLSASHHPSGPLCPPCWHPDGIWLRGVLSAQALPFLRVSQPASREEKAHNGLLAHLARCSAKDCCAEWRKRSPLGMLNRAGTVI